MNKCIASIDGECRNVWGLGMGNMQKQLQQSLSMKNRRTSKWKIKQPTTESASQDC